ncbi:tyrosine-type recombinase/integrase [Clostridium botulinum]|uniref:tyrosine-type recombinase/integrase n=1 Tax=Clostridium botulinum TaxID=1491 RepID=UPI000584B768|nr:tyrosine-type recombinase/integrase [Clostridium botulinum]AJD25579.1 phage integrase family protein [Clostridium botulinum CDC_297]AJE09307.1 phage integrase family protein [Clostridium botulinum CDC_1436]MBY6878126.1 tyrosine-type recombinase/integrase [Clostridium botulinum]MBY6881435.1 tyrosine-type recombinase/integrase [Clostridium botulinum]MBY6892917.1 tyrosine-type recombinase/integrase [Clostridium botulinum]
MKILYEDLVSIKNEYDNLKSPNEANVKTFVVIPFLKLLGYKHYWMDIEGNAEICRSPKDIVLYVNDDKNNLFFIETKNKTTKIEPYIDQLLKYMHQKGIEWGLITNGNDYILLNDISKLEFNEKIILRFNLNNILNYQQDIKIIEYFSYEYLFNRHYTKYFKYLPEFKKHLRKSKNLNEQSWRQYKSTLINYFIYLSNNHQKYDLHFIYPSDFKEFLKTDIYEKKNRNERHATSNTTIINKFNYLKSFVEFLNQNKYIKENCFENLVEDDILEGFSFDNKLSKYELLNNNEILNMFNLYTKKRNSKRNILILLIFLYTGLDIQEIQNIKDADINNRYLTINKRKIPLTEKLYDELKDYMNLKKSNKIKCEYLFYSKYSNKYDKLSGNTFIRIISFYVSEAKDIPKERKKLITPSFIRESLIKKMFKNGFTIEEIKYLTGLSLTSIGKYITNEDIANKIELKDFYKRHPYKAFF